MFRRPATLATFLLLSIACDPELERVEAEGNDGAIEFRATIGAPPLPEWCVGSGMCTGPEPCEETILCGDGHEIPTVHLCDPFSGCLTDECYPAPGSIEDEVCNGLDDDCDGTIDGVATPDCDDGIACTFDLCVEGECAPVPKDEVCVRTDCAQGQCNDDDFNGAQGSIIGTEDGCVYLLDDSYCENTYDSCACNGQSTCTLSPANGDGSGCVDPLPFNPFTGHNQFPCEDDQDNCTYEACCEPDEDCRLLDAMTPAQKEAYDFACAFVPRNTPSSTGEMVGCPGFQVGQQNCGNGDPCKVYGCDPNNGNCEVLDWVMEGAQVPGCGQDQQGEPVYGNFGCSTWECNGGGDCVEIPANLPANHPDLLCSGDVGGNVYQTCYTQVCANDGTCDTIGHDELCPDDDGNNCTIPRCGGEGDLDPDAKIWGCGWELDPDCTPE